MTTKSRSKLRISATKLRNFLECPHRVQLEKKYRPTKEEWLVGRLIHKAIENATNRATVTGKDKLSGQEISDEFAKLITDKRKLPGEKNRAHAQRILGLIDSIKVGPCVVPAETRFKMDLGDSVTLNGVWDNVQGSPEHVEVVDWKCVFKKLEQEEASADPQLGLYLVAAKHHWPDAETITATLIYLNEPGHVVRAAWTPELDQYWRVVAGSAARQIARGYSEPNVGPHCASCPVRNFCEAAKTASIDEHDAKPGELVKLPTPELAHWAYLLRSSQKINEAAKKDVDQELKRRVEAGEKLDDFEEFKASLRTREVRKIDPGKLPELAKKAGVSLDYLLAACVTGVNYDKLKSALGGVRAPDLNDATKTIHTKYLDVRRKKL